MTAKTYQLKNSKKVWRSIKGGVCACVCTCECVANLKVYEEV